MTHKLFKATAIAASMLCIGLSGSANAGASGAMLGNTCAGCHGTHGVSAGAAPSLKGLPVDYLKQAMHDFKSDKRPATIMNRIAKGYSDADIDAMAAYFGGMK